MEPPRQTFLVHVFAGGPQAVVEDVTSRERQAVPDVRDVGERIAQWVDDRSVARKDAPARSADPQEIR